MNSRLQFDENMTKEKGKSKNIVTGDKFKVDASVPLLKSFKSNDRVSLLYMICKYTKEVETLKKILNFM